MSVSVSCCPEVFVRCLKRRSEAIGALFMGVSKIQGVSGHSGVVGRVRQILLMKKKKFRLSKKAQFCQN